MATPQDILADDYIISAPSHSRLPRLDLGIDWMPRWEEFRSSLRGTLSGPKPVGNEAVSGGDDLSIEWVRTFRPGISLLAAIFLEAIFLWMITLPIWGFLPQSRGDLAPVQIETDWYVPTDLRPILLATEKKKTHAAAHLDDATKQEVERGADAFHPRQTILSVPVKMTHPRQTLIRPDKPLEPPKVVDQTPNVVEWAATPEIARPKIEYKASASTPQMRQTQKRAVAAPEVTETQKNPGPIDIADPNVPKLAAPMQVQSMSTAVRRNQQREAAPAPQIAAANAAMNVDPSNQMHIAAPAPLPSKSVPVAQRRALQSSAAPEVAANGNPEDMRRLIAISAAPAPPAPAKQIPQGNLAANISLSPEGTRPGSPNGSAHGATASKSATVAGGAAASLPAAISVSPAKAKSDSAGVAPAESLSPSADSKAGAIPSNRAASPAGPSGGVNMAALAPGALPEKLLTGKSYTMHVSSPNATSTRGSWMLSFAQLGADSGANAPKVELTAPEPTRTVDPRYPPDAMKQHITGEVVLYAIIRKDGSVDSVQVVKSLDPRLDRAASDALSQWHFLPGAIAGEAVDLEAVVHVPFQYKQLNY
jgi:TonB family protein